MRRTTIFLAAAMMAFVVNVQAAMARVSVNDLRCEQMAAPIGVDNPRPVFGWKIFADRRDVMQRAYRIRVAVDGGAEVWDSGWRTSERQANVEYEGRALESDKAYVWTVEVRSSTGEKCVSEAARFRTGLFSEKDWGAAQWIALEQDGETLFPFHHGRRDGEVGRYRLPEFRKEFSVSGEIERATAYVCGLGQFEFFANGKKVGNHFLDPGWTLYNKEAMYVSFDVTSLLNQGANTLGVMLGGGFYNIPNQRYYKLTGSFGAPKMKMRLVVHYKDGAMEDIVSDESWQAAESPIVFSSIYGGEDAIGIKGEKVWQPVLVCAPQPAIALKNQFTCPLTVRQEFSPVTITQTDSTRWLYDFGQNMSGIVRLEAKGKAGTRIRIRPAELLRDGRPNQGASGSPYEWNYTLGGNPDGETWQPRFTYYGFRYAEVTLTPALSLKGEGDFESPLPFEDIDTETTNKTNNKTPSPFRERAGVRVTALHTSYSAPEAGRFECSLPLLNKTYELIDWAMRSNMASVLTDCPHREKLGWLEQTYLMQPSLLYRYDLQLLYRKMADDMAASQTAEGVIPTIAPEYTRFADGFEDTPEWGSAFIIALWNIYRWYGDSNLISRYYPQMKRYVEYLDSRATDGIVAYGLGDWYDIGPNPPGYAQLTSNGVTATAIYHYNCLILSKIAALQGFAEEAALYAAKAEAVKQAFHKKYYNPDTQTYDRNSQTTNAVVLYFGLCPDSLRSRVMANLQADLESRNYALTAGDIGYSFLLKALAQNGMSETIFRMNNRYDVPGYGWQLAHGATALTESWQAYDNVSNNHFMLGHLMEWLFGGLAGLSQTEESVGFRTLKIDPQMVGDITHASATRQTSYGEARVSWRRELGNTSNASSTNSHVELNVTVPAGSHAEVWLPTDNINNVREHGRPISQKNIKEQRDGKLCLLVGSGEYKYEISNK